MRLSVEQLPRSWSEPAESTSCGRASPSKEPLLANLLRRFFHAFGPDRIRSLGPRVLQAQRHNQHPSGSPDMSSSSTVPVRMPCGVPGKACYIVWKTQFLVDDRYQLLRALGRGAYGIVVSARDSISGQKVAIKKISAVFENPIVAWRTLREVIHGCNPVLAVPTLKAVGRV